MYVYIWYKDSEYQMYTTFIYTYTCTYVRILQVRINAFAYACAYVRILQVRIHAFAYACTYVRMLQVHTCICIYPHALPCTDHKRSTNIKSARKATRHYVCVYVCMYVYVYVYMYIYCVYMYVCMCICVCVCVYIYIYILNARTCM